MNKNIVINNPIFAFLHIKHGEPILIPLFTPLQKLIGHQQQPQIATIMRNYTGKEGSSRIQRHP